MVIQAGSEIAAKTGGRSGRAETVAVIESAPCGCESGRQRVDVTNAHGEGEQGRLPASQPLEDAL
jgi:hypothetical protein